MRLSRASHGRRSGKIKASNEELVQERQTAMTIVEVENVSLPIIIFIIIIIMS